MGHTPTFIVFFQILKVFYCFVCLKKPTWGCNLKEKKLENKRIQTKMEKETCTYIQTTKLSSPRNGTSFPHKQQRCHWQGNS